MDHQFVTASPTRWILQCSDVMNHLWLELRLISASWLSWQLSGIVSALSLSLNCLYVVVFGIRCWSKSSASWSDIPYLTAPELQEHVITLYLIKLWPVLCSWPTSATSLARAKNFATGVPVLISTSSLPTTPLQPWGLLELYLVMACLIPLFLIILSHEHFTLLS